MNEQEEKKEEKNEFELSLADALLVNTIDDFSKMLNLLVKTIEENSESNKILQASIIQLNTALSKHLERIRAPQAPH